MFIFTKRLDATAPQPDTESMKIKTYDEAFDETEAANIQAEEAFERDHNAEKLAAAKAANRKAFKDSITARHKWLRDREARPYEPAGHPVDILVRALDDATEILLSPQTVKARMWLEAELQHEKTARYSGGMFHVPIKNADVVCQSARQKGFRTVSESVPKVKTFAQEMGIGI